MHPTPARIIATMVGLLLVGCSQTRHQQQAKERDAQPAADRIAHLSPAWQRATFLQAIDDQGQNCDQVIRARYQQDVRGLAMWTAQCHDGGRWAIYIGTRAFAQVARCSDLAASGLPACIFPKSTQSAAGSDHV
jgi:hypothetical protein